ncbi:MAG: H-type lectin domain-containing protein [Akkermansiaceae bacterium]|nr:H-type lectin domain-containing protein [Akkermansiaceae bacterium]
MELTPWNILSASVSAGLANKDWSLDTPPDDPETPRSYQIDVAFAASFAAPPVVHLGLCGFDSDQRDSTRISIRTTDITCGGFRIEVSTWSVTRLYGVEISWLAIGS